MSHLFPLVSLSQFPHVCVCHPNKKELISITPCIVSLVFGIQQRLGGMQIPLSSEEFLYPKLRLLVLFRYSCLVGLIH